jgi:hypothetical protein
MTLGLLWIVGTLVAIPILIHTVGEEMLTDDTIMDRALVTMLLSVSAAFWPLFLPVFVIALLWQYADQNAGE